VPETGATRAGANEHDIASGRFEHENDTGASNEPVSELTVMLVCAGRPLTMVAAAGVSPKEILAFALVPQFGVYFTGPEI